MAKGFIVAKIKYNDRNVFHCIDEEKKDRFYLMEDLLPKISEGKIANGFVCKRETGDYIRIHSDIPTVVRPMNFDLLDLCSFISWYFGQGGPASAYTQRSLRIAAKREPAGGRSMPSDFGRKQKPVAKYKPTKPEYTAWGSKGADYYVDTPKSNKLYSSNVKRVTKAVDFIKKHVVGSERIEFSSSDVNGALRFWNEAECSYDDLAFSEHGRMMVYWITRAVKDIYIKENVNCCMCFKLKSLDGQRDWALCFQCTKRHGKLYIEAEIKWKPKNSPGWSDMWVDWNIVDEYEDKPGAENPYRMDTGRVDEESDAASCMTAYLLNMWAEYRSEHGI